MRYDSAVSTYHVQNFGCRATQADGAALERQFESRGLTTAPAAKADLIILNTCTVTNSADQDARAAIRRAQRQNPSAKIIVTGCYAQRAPEEVSALPGVSCVVGNSHKHQLAKIVLDQVASPSEGFVPLASLSVMSERPTTNDQRPFFVSDIFAHTELLAAPVFESANHESDRTRPDVYKRQTLQPGCQLGRRLPHHASSSRGPLCDYFRRTRSRQCNGIESFSQRSFAFASPLFLERVRKRFARWDLSDSRINRRYSRTGSPVVPPNHR